MTSQSVNRLMSTEEARALFVESWIKDAADVMENAVWEWKPGARKTWARTALEMLEDERVTDRHLGPGGVKIRDKVRSMSGIDGRMNHG